MTDSTVMDPTMTDPDVPMIDLMDGNAVPQIGLGVLRVGDRETTPVVESALSLGYRHIDGAAGYGNEAGIGRALKAAGYDHGDRRRGLWVTTKLRDTEQGRLHASRLRPSDRPSGSRLRRYVYDPLADTLRLAGGRDMEGVRPSA